MKKKLRVFGVTLVCSTFLASVPLTLSKVYAEETVKSETATSESTTSSEVGSVEAPVPEVPVTDSSSVPEDPANPEVPTAENIPVPEVAPAEDNNQAAAPEAPAAEDEALRAELQSLVDRANAAVANADLYTEASIRALKTGLFNAQHSLDTNAVSDYPYSIDRLTTLINALVPVTTEPSTTEPSTTEPSTTEPSTTEPSTTEPSTTEPSTTEPSTTEPSTTEPLVKVPTIQVSDKTMYVGDKLTEEDILNWANFENAEGLQCGFEVVGDPIQVTALGSTLVHPGTHSIRFYIDGIDSNGEKVAVEKIVTLTVLNERETPKEEDKNKEETPVVETPNDKEDVTPLENPEKTSTEEKENALGKHKEIPEATKHIETVYSGKDELPKTGEERSGSLVALGVGLLGASVYVGLKRKKEVN